MSREASRICLVQSGRRGRKGLTNNSLEFKQDEKHRAVQELPQWLKTYGSKLCCQRTCIGVRASTITRLLQAGVNTKQINCFESSETYSAQVLIMPNWQFCNCTISLIPALIVPYLPKRRSRYQNLQNKEQTAGARNRWCRSKSIESQQWCVADVMWYG